MYAPLHFATGSYDWVTVGIIENPESLDLDLLKERALKLIDERGYRPSIKMLRFQIKTEKSEEIKVLMLDSW